MNDNELMLVDLSSIAHPIWHMSQNEPDPNHTSTAIVAKVRALTAGHPHAAICCDSGRSFRKDIAPSYKANRPAAEAPLHHQIDLAKEQLVRDGFPVWSVRGFEADDLIASGVVRALDSQDLTVLIVSSDKDLLQCVSQRVSAFSVSTNTFFDVAAVSAKFGVTPSQMGDYLALVGDSSDNIKGADKIGPKTAAKLLAEFGSLEAIYIAMQGATPTITPAVRTSLKEFEARVPLTRELIALRCDIDLPFDEIARERVSAETQAFLDEGAEPMEDEAPTIEELKTLVDAVDTAIAPIATSPVVPANGNGKAGPPDGPPPAEWERHLEPRSMREAITLANHMYSARLFSAYGTPQAVLSTILAGREFNMPAMASLRAFHIVEGRPTLAADAIRAFVLRSGKATYFRCTERTAESATFETQRGDDPPIALSYTMEEARASGRVKDKSGYVKDPADMLVARAGSKLARLVYPDVIHGLYAPEEFDE